METEKQRKENEKNILKVEDDRLRNLRELIEQKNITKNDYTSKSIAHGKLQKLSKALIFIAPLVFYFSAWAVPQVLALIGLFGSPLLFLFLAILYDRKQNIARRAVEQADREISALGEKIRNPKAGAPENTLHPDQQNDDQKALLMNIREGNWVTVKQLLSSGVKHNDIVDENGQAPLEIALKRKDAPMISLLESHGAKINPNTTLKRAQNTRRLVGSREVSD